MMNAIRITLFLSGLLLWPFFCNAQTEDSISVVNTSFVKGLVRPAPWIQPFWADLHSPLTKVEIAYGSGSPEYDFNYSGQKFKCYTFATVGANLPLWSGNFKNRQFGLSISAPIFAEIWLDLFEHLTSPLINTNYRLGAPELAYIQRFNHRFFKNYVLKLSLFKHESTHIGDEITLMRIYEQLPITRINVSYNYLELTLALNEPDLTSEANHAFKAGFMLLYNWNKSWYTMQKAEGDPDKVKPVNSPFECYFQYQFQSKLSKHHLQAVVSLELRNRAKYNYPVFDKNSQNQWIEYYYSNYRAWSINTLAGLRYQNPKYKGYFSKIGFGFRVYYGINPYGQFRSHPHYTQFGVSLIFE